MGKKQDYRYHCGRCGAPNAARVSVHFEMHSGDVGYTWSDSVCKNAHCQTVMIARIATITEHYMRDAEARDGEEA